MNVIVVGAGNAGRPVARLLNYAGHTVKITDPKKIEDFHMDVQKTLRLMESEGVELDLGVFEPNLDGIDTVYLSPTVKKLISMSFPTMILEDWQIASSILTLLESQVV